MAGYRKKGPAELAWLDSRDTITLQARQLLRRVLDEALYELDVEFNAALHRGELLDLSLDKTELKGLLLKAARRELGNGK